MRHRRFTTSISHSHIRQIRVIATSVPRHSPVILLQTAGSALRLRTHQPRACSMGQPVSFLLLDRLLTFLMHLDLKALVRSHSFYYDCPARLARGMRYPFVEGSTYLPQRQNSLELYLRHAQDGIQLSFSH